MDSGFVTWQFHNFAVTANTLEMARVHRDNLESDSIHNLRGGEDEHIPLKSSVNKIEQDARHGKCSTPCAGTAGPSNCCCVCCHYGGQLSVTQKTAIEDAF